MYLLKEILLASSVYGRDAVMGNLDLRAFPTSYLPENCFSGHERTPIPIEYFMHVRSRLVSYFIYVINQGRLDERCSLI